MTLGKVASGLIQRIHDMTLDKRLKQLNMTKKDLADALGITPEAVYRWEDTPKYADAYIGAIERRELDKIEFTLAMRCYDK